MLIKQPIISFFILCSYFNNLEAFLRPSHPHHNHNHISCYKIKNLKMSWFKNFENTTKEDLIIYNYDLSLDSKINKELSLLLDSKLNTLKTDISTLKTDLKAEITTLKTDLNAEITALKTDIKSLEKTVTPLSLIYAVLLTSIGAIGTFVFMILLKFDWSSLVK